MANAINLIDGLDGLACGIVMIAGAALFLYADRLFKAGLLEGSNMGPLVAAITVGICVGFLPHNFNPARIFMGDAGAMFLGLLLATTTITVGGRTADPFSGQTYFYFAPLAIPLVILGVPIFDTAFSFVRRLVKRQSFAQADHEHLHHRLMRMGHGPRRAVVILWLWTALLSAVVLLPTFTDRGNSLVPLARPGPRAPPLHLLPPRRPQRPGGRGARGGRGRRRRRGGRSGAAPGRSAGQVAGGSRAISAVGPERDGGAVPGGRDGARSRPESGRRSGIDHCARVLPAENFGLHRAPGLTFRQGVG